MAAAAIGSIRGDDTANQNYWFFGWLLQKQVTKQLAIGGEIFHQSSTVAFGATNPIYTQPTTGFNIGAIYDFDDESPPGGVRRSRTAKCIDDEFVLLVSRLPDHRGRRFHGR